jgi:hypothetical protein
MKWVPAPLWFVLPPRARSWGLVFLALSGLLSLAMLPLTIVQLQVLFGFGERPFRADYLVFIWSAVPWWWRLRHPFAFLSLSAWAAALRVQRDRAGRWAHAFRTEPRATFRLGRARSAAWLRVYLGFDDGRRDPGTKRGATAAAEIGD